MNVDVGNKRRVRGMQHAQVSDPIVEPSKHAGIKHATKHGPPRGRPQTGRERRMQRAELRAVLEDLKDGGVLIVGSQVMRTVS